MSTSSSPRKRKRAESTDSDKLAHVSPAIQLEERWSVIQETFESIYTGVDGYATARDVRKRLRNEGRYEETETLQYGEIDPVAFCKLLVKLPITSNETKQVFLDIGSGTGKPVIAAAMLPEIFETCAGIEIVNELHESAIVSLTRLKGMEKKIVAKCPEFKSEQIRLCCGDSFKLMSDSSKVDDKGQVEFPNIRDVDVLFAPTTCFTDELMLKLDHLVDRCKTGCVVITTTRKLTNSKCELKFEERIKYGRGSLNFLVYKIVKTKQVTNSSTPKVVE